MLVRRTWTKPFADSERARHDLQLDVARTTHQMFARWLFPSFVALVDLEEDAFHGESVGRLLNRKQNREKG